MYTIDDVQKQYTKQLAIHTDPTKALVETAAFFCLPVEEVQSVLHEEEGETV